MNRSFVLAAALALLGAGCATVDPRTAPLTIHDLSQPYSFPAEDRSSLKETIRPVRPTIAVAVNASRADPEVSDPSQFGKRIKSEIGSALRVHKFLRLIATSRSVADFANDEFRAAKGVPANLPDYVLLARIDSVKTTEDDPSSAGSGLGAQLSAGWNKLSSSLSSSTTTNAPPEPRHTVIVKVHFKLYDQAAGQAAKIQTISKQRSGVLKNDIEAEALRLAVAAAREHLETFVGEIGPVGRVLKTACGGRYAYIELGQEAGAVSGGRVRFLKREGDAGYAVDDQAEIDALNGEMKNEE